MASFRTASKVVCAAALLACAAAGAAAAEETAAAAENEAATSERLGDVLDRLKAEGLVLVYSSAIVDPDARVRPDPSIEEPRARLLALLRPLGLTVRDGPEGALLLVRLEPERRARSGRVVSAGDGRPIAGARVRWDAPRPEGSGGEATTGADGRFRVAEPLADRDEVRVEARGYRAATLPAERLAEIALEPLPTFVSGVVVTPGRRALVREKLSGAATVDRDDADRVPAIAGDPGRVMAALPGTVAAESTAAFGVRGSDPADVAWILDGFELYEPFHLPAFQSPFSAVDGDLVDRIEFLAGGWTADLGDRHGGFVRLETADPGNEDAPRSLRLGTTHSRVVAGSPDSPWVASLRAWYPEALTTTTEFGEDRLHPRFADAYLKWSGRAGERTAITGHGLLTYDRLDYRESDGAERVDATSRSGYVWLRVLHDWTDGVSSETVLSAGVVRRVRDGTSEPEDDSLAVRDRRRAELVGLRHDTSWMPGERNLVRAGVDLRWLRARYDYRLEAPPDGPSGSADLRVDPSGATYGVYLSHRRRWPAGITTEWGGRWDRQGYTGDSQWSPRLNVLWEAGPDDTLRAGWGLHHQSQRIHELRVEDGETRFRPAEKARQVALTWERRLPGARRARVDLYSTRLTGLRPRWDNTFNPVELFPETELDRVEVRVDRAELRGLEVSLRSAPGRRWSWSASYTLSSADDVIDGEEIPRPRDQRHAARALVSYRAEERWMVALSAAWHTGWPTTPIAAELVDGEAEVVLGPRNSERFPDFARLDLMLTRRFPLRRGALRLEIDLVNLTDRDNVCCVDEAEAVLLPDGTAEPVRDLDLWLGFVPSASVAWEW